MSDRLIEIEQGLVLYNTSWEAMGHFLCATYKQQEQSHVNWLIAEVKRLRSMIDQISKIIDE